MSKRATLPKKIYYVSHVLMERPTTRPERDKGPTQYLIKWKNYPYNQCTWIHEQSFSNLQAQNTPLAKWKSLSPDEKYTRSKFLSNWDEKTSFEKDAIGISYENNFRPIENESMSPSSQSMSEASEELGPSRLLIQSGKPVANRRDPGLQLTLKNKHNQQQQPNQPNFKSSNKDSSTHKRNPRKRQHSQLQPSNKTEHSPPKKKFKQKSNKVNKKQSIPHQTNKKSNHNTAFQNLTNSTSNSPTNTLSKPHEDMEIDSYSSSNVNKSTDTNDKKMHSKQDIHYVEHNPKSVNKSGNQKQSSNPAGINKNAVDVLIVVFMTNKNKQISKFNECHDKNYFSAIGYKEKHYPNNSFVHWCSISNSITMEAYEKQLIDDNIKTPTLSWIKSHNTFDNKYIAYLIEHHGVIDPYQPIDNQHYMNRRGAVTLRQEDINTIFKSNQYIQNLLNNSKLNVKIIGLVTDYKMISLIADNKKTAEFRSSKLIKFKKKATLTTPIEKQRTTLNVIPNRDAISYQPSPKTLWTDPFPKPWKEKFATFQSDLSIPLISYGLNYKTFIEMYSKWVVHKRVFQKNQNPTIIRHNGQLKKYAIQCFNRLRGPRSQLFFFPNIWKINEDINIKEPTPNFTILTNILIYIFIAPFHLESLFIHLDNINRYNRLQLPLMYILGFIKIPSCCNNKMHYKYRNASGNTSTFLFQCRKCKQHQSAWKNSQFCHKYKKWSMYSVLLHIFKFSQLNELKKQAIDKINVHLNLYNKIEKDILEDNKIFCQKYHLICGKNATAQLINNKQKTHSTIPSPQITDTTIDNNVGNFEKDVCIDHAFLSKLKYGRGFSKNNKYLQIMGITDSYSTFINQIVDTQKKNETEHYIQKYTQVHCIIDTDKAKCFDGIFLLERKHRSVNHSGELVAGKKVRFKNPVTGACSNPVEGNFGRVCQLMKIQKTHSVKNEKSLENYLSLHDMRYNRTNNIAAQLFINFLLVLTTVNPPQQPKIALPERISFKNVHYIDKIIGEKKDENGITMYLVKFTDFKLHESVWQYASDFNTDEPIQQWNALEKKHKESLFKKYTNFYQKHEQKQLNPFSVSYFSVERFIHFIDNKIWARAINLLKSKRLLECYRHQSNRNQIIALLESSITQKSYHVTLLFKKKRLNDWSCECEHFKKTISTGGPKLFCKHITAVCIYISNNKIFYLNQSSI